MFSSISKSVAALIPRGPKALLASAIASALSTFFDVDEKAIESNLLSDTKIVLRGVKLRPTVYKHGSALVRTEGLVEEVTFSWTWSLQGSGSKESNLVQDATLMVRGLRLRTTLQKWDDCDEAERSEYILDCTTAAANQVNAKDGKKNQGYLQRCLQQVIDHLSVVITDFEFAVEHIPSRPMNPEANEGTSIVAVGTDVQLVTLKAMDNPDGSTALGQKIRVGSFSISVVDGTTHFPIIEEFGYSASVTRLTGQRFIGGIGSGLEVVGVPNQNSGVVFHAGIVQTQALCTLAKLMVPSTKDFHYPSPDNVLQHTIISEPSEEKHKPASPKGVTSTIFILTFPPISLILPNKTRMTIPDATLSFSTDRKLFRLHGGEHGTGIMVNNSPILQFGNHVEENNSAIRTSGSVRWILDFVKGQFVIEGIQIGASEEGSSKSSKSSELAKLMCRKDQLRLILQGFSELASNKDVKECTIALKSGRSHNEKGAKAEKSWSFHAKGILRIWMEEKRNANDIHWMEAAVDSPSITMTLESSGTCAVTQIGCEGIQFNSCFFDTFSSQIDFLPESNTLQIVNGIDVSIRSLKAAQNLQSFLSDFLEAHANAPSVAEEKKKLRPMDVSLCVTKLVLNMQEPLTKISVENIKVRSNNEATCVAVNFELKNGASASFTGVRADFANLANVEIRIKQIMAFCIPGVLCLSKPTLEVNAKFVEGALRIAAKSIYIQGFDTSKPDHQNVSLASDGNNDIRTWLPVQLILDGVTIRRTERDSTRLLLRRINFEVKSKGSSIEACINDQLVCMVKTRSEKWAQFTLNETWLVLSNEGRPKEIRCAGVMLGPFSCGKCLASISKVHATLSPKYRNMAVNGIVSVALDSLDGLQKIQNIADELVKSNSKGSQGSEQPPLFPFPIQIAETNINLKAEQAQVIAKNISLENLELRSASIYCKYGSCMSASMVGVNACIDPLHLGIQVDSLSTLDIPDMIQLCNPSTNILAFFNDGVLHVELDTLRATLLHQVQQGKKSTGSGSQISFPFPVKLNCQELNVTARDGDTLVITKNIKLQIESGPSGLSFQMQENVDIRLAQNPSEWIVLTLYPSSLSFTFFHNVGMCLDQLHYSGVRIGPCSYKDVSVHIPAIDLCVSKSQMIIEQGLQISTATPTSLQNAHRLILNIINSIYKSDSSDEFEFPFTINMSEIKLSMRDPQAQVVVGGIFAQHGDVICRSLHVIEAEGVSATVSGLKANVSRLSSPRVDISLIETIFVPGVISLSKPMENVVISFSDNMLQFSIPTVNATILSYNTKGKPGENKSCRSDLSVPMPMHLIVQEVWLSRSKDKEQNWLSIRHFDIEVHPTPMPICKSVGVGVTVHSIGELRNELFQAKNIAASGLLHPNRLDVLQHFDFCSEIVYLAPGFSSIEWSALSGKGMREESSNSIKLPFAKIAGLKVQISYEGKLLTARETAIDVPPFIGNANTTSETLTKFYSDSILNHMPRIIANTEVLGKNVTDSSFANVGRLAAASSVAGAGVGSVAGIAVLDSINGAVREGKQQRNASQHESYKFGDFTRGTLHSMKKASDLGGKLRRGQSKNYVPGDVTVGAATAATSYARENSERLGSAGGGGVGMMVGAAVAGPFGLLAGAYLGGQAGKKVFEGEDPQKEEQQTAMSDLRISPTEPTQHPQNNGLVPRNNTLVSREEDLLDLSYSASNLPHQNHQITNSGANTTNQNLAMQSNLYPRENHGSTGSYVATSQVMHSQNRNLQREPGFHDQVGTSDEARYHNHGGGPPFAASRNSSGHPPTTVAAYKDQDKGGYRFGDITKSIISQGKVKEGRDKKSDYKFGDFTRGLFG